MNTLELAPIEYVAEATNYTSGSIEEIVLTGLDSDSGTDSLSFSERLQLELDNAERETKVYTVNPEVQQAYDWSREANQMRFIR